MLFTIKIGEPMQNHTLKKLRTLALLSLIGNCTVAQNKEASDIKTPVEEQVVAWSGESYLKRNPLHNMWEGALHGAKSISNLPQGQKQAALHGYQDVQFANKSLTTIQKFLELKEKQTKIDELAVQIFSDGRIRGKVKVYTSDVSKEIELDIKGTVLTFPYQYKTLTMDKKGKISVNTAGIKDKTIFHNGLVHDIRFVHQMGGKSYLFDSSFRTETAPLTFTAIRDGKFNDTNMGILKMLSLQEKRCFYYGHISDLTDDVTEKQLNTPSIKTLPKKLKGQAIRSYNNMLLARKIYPIIQKYLSNHNIKEDYDAIRVDVFHVSDLILDVSLMKRSENNLLNSRIFLLNESGDLVSQKEKIHLIKPYKQIIFDPRTKTAKVGDMVCSYIGKHDDFYIKNNYGESQFFLQGSIDEPIICVIHQMNVNPFKPIKQDGKEATVSVSEEFFKKRTTFWKGHFSELLDGEDEKIFDFDSYIRKHPIIKNPRTGKWEHQR